MRVRLGRLSAEHRAAAGSSAFDADELVGRWQLNDGVKLHARTQSQKIHDHRISARTKPNKTNTQANHCKDMNNNKRSDARDWRALEAVSCGDGHDEWWYKRAGSMAHTIPASLVARAATSM